MESEVETMRELKGPGLPVPGVYVTEADQSK